MPVDVSTAALAAAVAAVDTAGANAAAADNDIPEAGKPLETLDRRGRGAMAAGMRLDNFPTDADFCSICEGDTEATEEDVSEVVSGGEVEKEKVADEDADDAEGVCR